MEIIVLSVAYEFGGANGFLHPVILRNNKEAILVDCGYPGYLSLIEAAALKQNFSMADLTGLVLTHHDIDHIGAAYDLKAKYPIIRIYASEVEAEYICGFKKSQRLQQAEDLFDSLPEEHRPFAIAFQTMLKSLQQVPVDVALHDGASLLDGAVEVISTPGHTAGHISLYVKEQRVLIAADALVIENGELAIANPMFTLDMEQALASVRRLAQLDIASVICYHGGIMTENISGRMKIL